MKAPEGSALGVLPALFVVWMTSGVLSFPKKFAVLSGSLRVTLH